MAFAEDIRRWPTAADLAAHLARHDPAIAPWAKAICLHHTYTPTVSQWRGIKTLYGTRGYYIGLGWTSGPHLFICGNATHPGDKGVFQLTPLNLPGIHAGRCNSDHFAIEVVGRYDRAGWLPATSELVYGAILALMDWRGITDVSQVVGHRECMPNQKTCPGTAINMTTVRAEVARRLSLQAANDLAFISEQRISERQFISVLERAGSPAAPDAQRLAEIPPIYDIDRAVALAFFEYESSFGKAGICKEFNTRNWGMVRRPFDPASAIGSTPHPFAIYSNWPSGLHDWCRRIRGRYVAEGLTTVRKALPVYAPSSDGNRPQRYADAVVAAVVRWQREDQS